MKFVILLLTIFVVSIFAIPEKGNNRGGAGRGSQAMDGGSQVSTTGGGNQASNSNKKGNENRGQGGGRAREHPRCTGDAKPRGFQKQKKGRGRPTSPKAEDIPDYDSFVTMKYGSK